MPIKILETKPLHKTKFLNLMSTSYKDLTGATKDWVWAQRPNETAAVMVVPTVVTPSGLKVCLIREMRIPLEDFEWGFPAGLVDKGESIEKAAKRELKEETGLDLVKVIKVSPPGFNSAGMTSEAISVLFCEASGTLSNEGHESSEQIEVYLMSMEEVQALLDDKTKKIGSKAWIILYMLLEMNKLTSSSR